MNIVRAPRKQGFVVIPNQAVEDRRLSYRARGLLAYLLSRPDGWRTDSERLAETAREGRDAVRTALRELESADYLRRHRGQDERGHWVTETVVIDDPADWKTDAWKSVVGLTSGNAANPQVAPTTGKPTVGKPGAIGLSKTENKEGELSPGQRDAFTSGQPVGCRRHGTRRPACDDCQRTGIALDRVHTGDYASHAGQARSAIRGGK